MKKFVISFTITLLMGLLLIGLFVYLEDPFYHYHKPFFGSEAYMDNALYQTPGAAEHLQYDAVIVGSSMTENFRASWFEEMGLNLLKLSYAGAEFKDYETILNHVYASGHDVKMVVIDINEFQLLSDVNAVYKEYPEYLYDGIRYDDTKYLYNNDVFWEAADRMLERIFYNRLKGDDSYTWENDELFSEEQARKDYDIFREGYELAIANGGSIENDEKDMKEKCRANMELLVELISSHPETEFIVYYPPYSTLFWQEIADENKTDVTLELYRMSMQALLECSNAKVFNYQDEETIVTKLDRYRDVCHHDYAGNRYIFECIRDAEINGCDEHMINAGNIDRHISHMRDIINDYVTNGGVK